MPEEIIKDSSILIVDDTPINLDILFEYLDAIGFEVFVAEDGQSALEQAEYTNPDIILLDVLMPGIDGFETCRRLKANPKTANIPVIFMTALADTGDKVTGFEVGAVDYVTKPLQYKEVLARLITHLTVRQLQRNLERQNTRLQQEIEQRKEAEAALQAQTLELQARNDELDAFSRTVAHDIKIPLGTVMGYAQMISSRLPGQFPEKETILEYATAIEQGGSQLNNITDELLLLARIRDDAVPLKTFRYEGNRGSMFRSLSLYGGQVSSGADYAQRMGGGLRLCALG